MGCDIGIGWVEQGETGGGEGREHQKTTSAAKIPIARLDKGDPVWQRSS
jgi:hypothetical protein